MRAWLKDPQFVERKHAEIFASRLRRFEYYQSYVFPPPPLAEPSAELLAPLEAYLDAVSASRGRGRGVRVLAYPRAGGNWLFLVRHGDPPRREGAMDGAVETSVLYRPLRFDVVGYDAAAGTLRVYARSNWERSLYRGGFGKYLFGAMDHFPGTGRYTLEPLRAGDPACLACADAAPIKHVNLVEVHLHYGGIYDSVEVHKATDVLAALRQRKAGMPQGPRIGLAAFELWPFGESRPLKVTVLPPNVARYSHEDQSELVDHWLGLRGFIQTTGAANERQGDTLLRVR